MLFSQLFRKTPTCYGRLSLLFVCVDLCPHKLPPFSVRLPPPVLPVYDLFCVGPLIQLDCNYVSLAGSCVCVCVCVSVFYCTWCSTFLFLLGRDDLKCLTAFLLPSLCIRTEEQVYGLCVCVGLGVCLFVCVHLVCVNVHN